VPDRVWLRVVAVAAGCAMVLAGCASSGSTGSGSAGTVSRASVVAPGVSVPFDPADNVRSEVKVGTCAAQGDVWVARGTVKNGATSPKTFQIVVDFVSVPGSTVLSSTVVTIGHVGAGTTAPWSASGAKGAHRAACLLRQAQAT
jgi:hypothetical protein